MRNWLFSYFDILLEWFLIWIRFRFNWLGKIRYHADIASVFVIKSVTYFKKHLRIQFHVFRISVTSRMEANKKRKINGNEKFSPIYLHTELKISNFQVTPTENEWKENSCYRIYKSCVLLLFLSICLTVISVIRAWK